MNKWLVIILAFLFLGMNLGLAQNNRVKREDAGKFHPKGKAIAFVDMVDVPTNLSELAQRADLIIQGTVESILSSRYLNSDVSDSMETDLWISVQSILKGPKGEPIERVVVSQFGGKIEDLEIVVLADPLMQSGENYILFLKIDNRTDLPNYDKGRRYTVVGGESGKFKIEGHKIKTLPNIAENINAYEGKELDKVTQEILELLKSFPSAPPSTTRSSRRRRQ
ncbi:MAG: hypothetical protein HYR55_04260 [Acidobacteria bacterium]|nr:hypothetical protein [Acidobacteriota bacterium]MBI3658672.1 hypothetical protein [Acidobacteriota bacterium]